MVKYKGGRGKGWVCLMDNWTEEMNMAWWRHEAERSPSCCPVLTGIMRALDISIVVSQNTLWNKLTNEPVALYYSHLVAVRCRGSINCMHAGTRGFSYMTHTHFFLRMKRRIPILKKSLPHRFQIRNLIGFSYFLDNVLIMITFHFTSL